MGWTVLYIAFGLVALWLLGEVLLQYKARLRWRLLAFAGFLGVVAGVLLSSVPVIVIGTLAFATGQAFVTLSFRRGFSTGWAIGGNPGESRRRRSGGEGAAVKDPTLEVSGLEISDGEPAGYDTPPAAPPTPSVYAPQPMPDDTGQYGVYGATGHGTNADGGQTPGHDTSPPAQPQYPAYDPYPGYEPQPAQDPYAGTYDYGADPQSYAAYSDPYIGTTNGAPSYGGYDGYGHDGQGGQQNYADPYGRSHGSEQYATDTPPGGVWVPQQRDAEQYPPMPPEQPAGPTPYGNGYDTGQNEQYRY
ncbi:hypothetical protein ACIODW_05400 [Streptomyces sp. NPDC087897]|uniref:hypothetical protein n=1 Tax=Streptomyces sp. NPDC087897 TaxID=3365817 RepID=UPI0038309B2F